MKTYMRTVWVLLSCALPAACQSSSSPMPELSAGVLADGYEGASAAVRSKYEGKEVKVKGFTSGPPTMPQDTAEQGALLLREVESGPGWQVTCWFTAEQSAEFSRIEGGQYVTVKGVFTGETGAALRFCKLIKIVPRSR